MKIFSQLEQLSTGPVHLSAVQSDDPPALLNRFREYALRSGKAMYCWRVEIGLAPLGIKPIVIPNTHSLEAALHYIADSRHYGIYILCGVNDELNDPRIVDIFRKIQDRALAPHCHILVLDQQLSIPAELNQAFKTVRHRSRKPVTLTQKLTSIR